MVLATVPINLHRGFLFLLWRHRQRVRTVYASREYSVFRLIMGPLCYTFQYKEFQFGDVVVRVGLHIPSNARLTP